MHEPFVGDEGPREITVPDHPLLSIGDPAAKARGRQGDDRWRRKAGAASGPSRDARAPPAKARRRNRRR
jgi:hypothetical protein